MKHSGLRGKLILRFFFLQRSCLYFWSPELFAAPNRSHKQQGFAGKIYHRCRWPDSNRHGPVTAQRILSPLRLPFRHIGNITQNQRAKVISFLARISFVQGIVQERPRSSGLTPINDIKTSTVGYQFAICSFSLAKRANFKVVFPAWSAEP